MSGTIDRAPGRSSPLQAGERRLELDGIPILVHARLGDSAKPLVVFLTGGGVLARITYGHPGAEARDFLDHWLARAGWGLLAASYPSDHGVFAQAMPELGLSRWAAALADLILEQSPEGEKHPILLCGWSMGGKLVFALTRELRLRGRSPECFVSLCATPPFPRLSDGGQPPERLLPDGHWDISGPAGDGSIRDDRWFAELASIALVEKRVVISPEAFLELYRANTPPGLWGPELEPYFKGRSKEDPAQTMRGASLFSGEDYPVCAAIIPEDPRDHRHALTDEAVWGGITIQGLLHNRISKELVAGLSQNEWIRLREAVVRSPGRLSRHVSGGHFFFVGASGAQATVEHLKDLFSEVARLKATISNICGSASSKIGIESRV